METAPIHVIDCDADPFVPHPDWKVIEHQQRGLVIWNPDQIKRRLHKHQRTRNGIVGKKLCGALTRELTCNANLLDYLLRCPHLIPEEWKRDEDDGRALWTFFWATIYWDPIHGGHFCVRCLYHNGTTWLDYWLWLSDIYHDHYPAAVHAN